MARAPSACPRPGAPPVLSRGRVRFAPEESPDGRFVFYPKGKAIWRCRSRGATRTKIVEAQQAIFTGWDVYDHGLCYLRRTTGWHAGR